ncbi:MAG: AraC family transcriptional regulator [Pseudoflavonifractor sp.]
MSFSPITLARPLVVDRVVTVHYFEYPGNYYFEGETHDFWELLYVDKGELEVDAGGRQRHLTQGQLIFHRPGEFHALRCNGVVAPNLVVLSFYCQSPYMAFFEGLVSAADETQRALLGQIVLEGEGAFSTPLNDPNTVAMERSPEAPFGAEQLLGGALEALLISLYRRGNAAPEKATGLPRSRSQAALYDEITAYLERNLAHAITLEQVCRDNLVGRSRLQQLFRHETGGGVMEQFGRMRIEGAKRMIREGGHNFTEVAAAMGYQSIYYFSRQFKKVTGMTPSEYASGVKILATKTKPIV